MLDRLETPSCGPDVPEAAAASPIHVALLTGGWDRPYAFGLTTSLCPLGITVDVICGDDLDIAEFRREPRVRVHSFRRELPPGTGRRHRLSNIAAYYARLVRYAWSSRAPIFHLLWNNKFETFDRVFLMLYYRLLGKRIVLTAHNVNAAARDARDTPLNRWTLRFQYRLSDHIFVHTAEMKSQLVAQFGVRKEDVTVIPFGINNSVPMTGMTPGQAKHRLGLTARERTILFFGNIAPYKGLEYLVGAFRRISAASDEYRLIVAGRPKGGFESYWDGIRATLGDDPRRQGYLLETRFIPDDETEIYFKAADVLVLPYASIFQSGVLFLGYSFGLPVLAADVGSLRDDVVEGRTGSMFRSRDAGDLARALGDYFSSEVFAHLDERRADIRAYAAATYSWQAVASATRAVYASLRPTGGARP